MNDNGLLREHYDMWTQYGVLYYPSVTINKVSYRGDLTPLNIVEAICASFWSQPQFCMDFYVEENIQVPLSSHNSIVTGEVLIVVAVLLIAVNLGLIYVYRRCAK